MRTAGILVWLGLMVFPGLLAANEETRAKATARPQTEAEWEEALAPYVARAAREFPAILERYLAKKDDDPAPVMLLVIRRQMEGDEKEDVILRLEEVTPTGILYGRVVGDYGESSPLQADDRLGIVASEVHDWAYREGRKPIEGFIVKRARTAIISGIVFVLFDLQADAKGRLIHAELSRALLPITRDDVTDLLPAKVAMHGYNHLFEFYKKEKVPERFAQVTLFYSFPEGLPVVEPSEKSPPGKKKR